MSTSESKTSTPWIPKGRAVSGDRELGMVVSSETVAALEELAQRAHEDVGQIILRGIALLMVAAKANDEGKQIGIGRKGGPLETVIDVF